MVKRDSYKIARGIREAGVFRNRYGLERMSAPLLLRPQHRVVDMLKGLAEVHKLEMENLRCAARLFGKPHKRRGAGTTWASPGH